MAYMLDLTTKHKSSAKEYNTFTSKQLGQGGLKDEDSLHTIILIESELKKSEELNSTVHPYHYHQNSFLLSSADLVISY